jgi:4-amino-4-deoxy-L-arabinose transferase-like glycosyltransferase
MSRLRNEAESGTLHPVSNVTQAVTADYGRRILGLAILVAVLRVLYLAFLCPLELVGDEAQYWDWARHLDWCYYSKGPGVAWSIAASTFFFGHHEWAVRLPAVLAALLTMLVLYRFTRTISQGNALAAWYTALLFLLTPVYFGIGFLMTIDGPYIACWTLALYAGYHALNALENKRSSLPAWLALGLALGAGEIGRAHV